MFYNGKCIRPSTPQKHIRRSHIEFIFHQISDFQSERLEIGAHVANGFGFESFVMRRSCQPSSLAYMEKKFEAVQVAPGHAGILHLGL